MKDQHFARVLLMIILSAMTITLLSKVRTLRVRTRNKNEIIETKDGCINRNTLASFIHIAFSFSGKMNNFRVSCSKKIQNLRSMVKLV